MKTLLLTRFGRNVLSKAAIAAMGTALVVLPALAQQARNFDVPAQDAAAALRSAAIQGGFDIIIPPKLVVGKKTQEVRGNLPAQAALERMLGGTGLKARVLEGKTWTVEESKGASGSSSALPTTLTGGVLLALADGQAPISGGERGSVAASTTTLEKVVVTANRREQSLSEFAGSVTPLSGKELDRIGASSMADYLAQSPGVVFSSIGPGNSNITIRGVGTTTVIDQGQQSTGLFINDIPLTEPVFNMATPDIDTFDVERVEVLRGPQGTSFGSGSLGGAVNYIATRPKMGVLEGRVLAGVSRTSRSTEPGADLKAMLNIPFTENFSVRGVLAARKERGFLDNLGTAQKGSNDTNLEGGRLMADWTASPDTTVRWLSLRQTINNTDGSSDSSQYGTFLRRSVFPEVFDTGVEIHSLKVEHDFSRAALSVSLTNHKKNQNSAKDMTQFVAPYLGGKAPPTVSRQIGDSSGDTFEARLTSSTRGDFEWLVGAFHDKTKVHYLSPMSFPGASAAIEKLYAPMFGPGIGAVGAPGDVIFDAESTVDGTESALFAEGSWKFAPAWKLTLGGRLFSTEVLYKGRTSGFYNYLIAKTLLSNMAGEQKEDGFSPKIVLAYNPNQDLLLYGLVSRGYRYGGPNPNPPDKNYPTPRTFKSDSLINYELGVRASSSDGKISGNLTAFFIDWSDIQLRMYTPMNFAYADNVGNARNSGVEASATWRPNQSFSAQASLTWLRARLVNKFDPGGGQPISNAGATLPGAAEWRASAVMNYMGGGEYAPFATLAYRYQGGAPAELVRPNIQMGNFSLVDLRGGFSLAGVTYTAFVTNVFNKAAVSNNRYSFTTPAYDFRYYARPRTIGLQADYKF